jgi:Cytochrome bd terminal oxidase subunit II
MVEPQQGAKLLGIAPKTLRRAAEAGEIEALHPLPDGPWIFARAAPIAHRACTPEPETLHGIASMISAVAPIWDGNETWLVVSGVILWGAFPIIYSTLMSAFYLPVLLMLAGLILRGVAFRRSSECAGSGIRSLQAAPAC